MRALRAGVHGRDSWGKEGKAKNEPKKIEGEKNQKTQDRAKRERNLVENRDRLLRGIKRGLKGKKRRKSRGSEP